jgi:para-nitrobenzyl esterase
MVSGVPCGNLAYTVFKGIPYSRPPVGELRWREPEPSAPWEGVRVCDRFSPASIQNDAFEPDAFYQKEFNLLPLRMDEDCLYLNVWTPAVSGTEKLPVMVWIHGGAYLQGYSYEMEFDGEALCKRGVLLVTVAYRLGALGFFAHPELSKRSGKNVSGNYGLLDSLAALKWVNQNIGSFGGDPENITVFGQSAGGGIVQGLVTSDIAKGLFHKAVIQSAAGIKTLGGKLMLHDAEKVGIRICEICGKNIDELLTMDAGELTKCVLAATQSIESASRLMMPNVDGYVLTDDPGDAIACGKHHDIPYLSGSVAGDCYLRGGALVRTKKELEDSVRTIYGHRAENYLKLFDVKNEEDLKRILPSMQRAYAVLAPLSWAKAHLKMGRKPVYTYYFDRDIPGGDKPGAFHSSELWYLFGTIGRSWRPMEDVDFQISDSMISYWTNFAKYGDPNGEGLNAWPDFTTDHLVTMRINENKIAAENLTRDKIVCGMADLLIEEVYGR